MTSQTPFILHPEYKDLKPGEFPSGFKQITSSPSQRGCLKVIVLCNGLLLLALGVYLLQGFIQSKRFLEEGHSITAQVIACRMVYRDDFDSPEVQYSYTVDGVLYQQMAFLSDDCTAYTPGQDLRGVYLPSDPTQSLFVKRPKALYEIFNRILFIFLFFGCTGTLSVTGLLGMGYYSLRSSGLFQNWDHTNSALEGHIVKIYYEADDLLVVEYRFQLSSQQSVDGRDKARQPDLVAGALPLAGTPVIVLYSHLSSHQLM
jgi:hypothetical protein